MKLITASIVALTCSLVLAQQVLLPTDTPVKNRSDRISRIPVDVEIRVIEGDWLVKVTGSNQDPEDLAAYTQLVVEACDKYRTNK